MGHRRKQEWASEWQKKGDGKEEEESESEFQEEITKNIEKRKRGVKVTTPNMLINDSNISGTCYFPPRPKINWNCWSFECWFFVWKQKTQIWHTFTSYYSTNSFLSISFFSSPVATTTKLIISKEQTNTRTSYALSTIVTKLFNKINNIFESRVCHLISIYSSSLQLHCKQTLRRVSFWTVCLRLKWFVEQIKKKRAAKEYLVPSGKLTLRVDIFEKLLNKTYETKLFVAGAFGAVFNGEPHRLVVSFSSQELNI